VLESYQDASDLYLARADEVSPYRPFFTGDYFEIDAETGWLIAAHPCAMRGREAELLSTVLVLPVQRMESPPRADKWAGGHYRQMPLPDLQGSFRAASFDGLTRLDTSTLSIGDRKACLSQFGINLLQQRMIFYLTRFEVTTSELDSAFAHTFTEADLLEEWVEATVINDDTRTASTNFENIIHSHFDDEQTLTLQDALRVPQHRATVRQRLRRLATSQISPPN
jgi:hypothetical protein